VLQIEKRIRGRVKQQMERSQREYYLNEQMKAIQKNWRDGRGGHQRIAELEAHLEGRHAEGARDKANAEINKLKLMSRCRPRRPWCATTSTGW